MKLRSLLRLTAAVLAVLLLGAVAVAAEDAAPVTRLYLRNDATTCPGNTFLSKVAGTADVNCGYIHGAPFGEVYGATGDTQGLRDYRTLDEEGAYTLDASRDIPGQITIRNGRPDANVPARIGVGEVVVDLTLTGEKADGSQVALGTKTIKGNATPGVDSFAIPFTFDLDPALGQPVLSSVTLRTNVHGTHAYSGYTGANNTSYFDVPLVPAPTPAP